VTQVTAPGSEAVGRLVTVCVVHELRVDPHGDVQRTAIDKRPVEGRVRLDPLGPVGDTVMDRKDHGGVDKAVYAYASEDLADWSALLGRELTPGQFGENLATAGVDVTGAVIGERWRVGDAEVVVRMPRMPCRTFQDWMDEPHWVKRFTEHGAPGAYLAVERPGTVGAGDVVEVIDRPDHGVRLGEVFAGRNADPDRLRLLLDSPGLAPDLVAQVSKVLSAADL
jgi:MOSC domain-containing protein YiiM